MAYSFTDYNLYIYGHLHGCIISYEIVLFVWEKYYINIFKRQQKTVKPMYGNSYIASKKKKQYKNHNNIESKELVQVYFIINIFVYSLRT